jgi:hypothetical protein
VRMTEYASVTSTMVAWFTALTVIRAPLSVISRLRPMPRSSCGRPRPQARR